MTTHDYELLNPPAATIASIIDLVPAAVRILNDETLMAMLGWAQGNQRSTYESCYGELHRRRDDPDAQPCHDCGVTVESNERCYGIDCGYVLCDSCGKTRGLSDDYLLPA